MKSYEPVIGMEIHVELKTKSKMFCGCKNDPFFAKHPNIYTCPVCLGLPGALPVPNKKAIEWAIKLGLALGCETPLFSKFDRKNYFYPDLPKGYQISQYDQPLAINGSLELSNNPIIQSSNKLINNKIRIQRVHLEEDTGKLLHTTVDGKKVTLVDFNRSGVPLMEIVTEPDIKSGEQAKEFLKKIHQIIRYLGISDADMEKGSMRLEPNISVRSVGTKELPKYKVEVKNINSFIFVKKAIEYEVERHIDLLEQGKTPVQETRGWTEGKNETISQRIKEEANDYRYFPEPDIPPMRWEQSVIRYQLSELPELPDEKKARFIKDYELNDYDAGLLTDTKELADYFEECVKMRLVPAKKLANWIINKKVDIDEVLPATLVKSIIKASAVSSISDAELETAVKQVLDANPKAVSDYKNGKEQALMFLFGNIFRTLKGKGDKMKIMEILTEELKR
jgi:aspartyl-tRNA(Asn)/glutamyl-tRNA(Gln) amidotransferase subunit B